MTQFKLGFLTGSAGYLAQWRSIRGHWRRWITSCMCILKSYIFEQMNFETRFSSIQLRLSLFPGLHHVYISIVKSIVSRAFKFLELLGFWNKLHNQCWNMCVFLFPLYYWPSKRYFQRFTGLNVDLGNFSILQHSLSYISSYMVYMIVYTGRVWNSTGIWAWAGLTCSG